MAENERFRFAGGRLADHFDAIALAKLINRHTVKQRDAAGLRDTQLGQFLDMMLNCLIIATGPASDDQMIDVSIQRLGTTGLW